MARRAYQLTPSIVEAVPGAKLRTLDIRFRVRRFVKAMLVRIDEHTIEIRSNMIALTERLSSPRRNHIDP